MTPDFVPIESWEVGLICLGIFAGGVIVGRLSLGLWWFGGFKEDGPVSKETLRRYQDEDEEER